MDIKLMVLEIFGALLQTQSGARYPVRQMATIAGSLMVEKSTALATLWSSRAKYSKLNVKADLKENKLMVLEIFGAL